jgi:thioredoxin 1
MRLMKFEQENCTPCKILGNILKYELEVEPDEIINISKGTVTRPATGEVIKAEDEVLEMASDYEIMKTPTMVLIEEDGTEIARMSGADVEEVKAIVAKRGLI